MAPGTNAKYSVKHSLTNAESPRHPENLHEMHPASRGNYGLESSGGYTILPAESSLLELPKVPKPPVYLRYIQRLPAELLQLLNLPVVPQLGGKGASLVVRHMTLGLSLIHISEPTRQP